MAVAPEQTSPTFSFTMSSVTPLKSVLLKPSHLLLEP